MSRQEFTRKELTGRRDLAFSGWVREQLPKSNTGLMVSDLDFILYNYKTKNVMLLEIKTRGCEVKVWQRNLFKSLSKWIKAGIEPDWTFHNHNLITFENTWFDDGKCYFNNKEISEKELVEVLSI